MRLLVLSLLVTWVGCSRPAFSPHFADNHASDLAPVLAQLKSRPERPINGTGQPTAYVVSADSKRLVAFDLSQLRMRWQASDDIASRIAVGTAAIVYRGGGNQLVARDVTTGETMWRTSVAGGRLLGIAVDGGAVYYVTEELRATDGGAAASVVALGERSGRVLWTRNSPRRLGAPAARDGVVAVPLAYQSIAFLSARDGGELARIRSKDEALLWVRSTVEGLAYGGKRGIYRLDENSISGTAAASSFLAAGLPDAVRPTYWWDGYNAALAGYTAYDRNRLLWEPATQPASSADGAAVPSLRLRDGRIFVHTYRFFFAFDLPKEGDQEARVSWAYSHPRTDVVASSYTGKSLVLVSSNGDILTIDPATGVASPVTQLKFRVGGATIDARGLSMSRGATSAPKLADTLAKMIWDPDRRFSAVKLFCVDQLAKLPGAEVSERLVEIVTRKGVEREVYERAGEMLVKRADKDAISLYVKKLATHYDFLTQSEPRAVGVFARALGQLKAPEAVRPLLLHMADHETSVDAMHEIVKALVQIGDPAIVEPFRDFLLTYRCSAEFTTAPEVLNLAADALLALGGPEERQLLIFVGNDTHTVASLRGYLATALRQTADAGQAAPAAAAQ